MERVDVYDEYMNFVGSEDRDVVHRNGLWHKTVHCWLYDKYGHVYFQIRKNSQKLYTTASGHVQAGETVKQAFHREVLEEIGVDVDLDSSVMVEINAWRLDKMKNGIPFIDRAFANVYLNEIDENINDFKFCEEEVSGLVKVRAQDCMDMFLNKTKVIEAQKINAQGIQKINITSDSFLVLDGEVAILKYGKILQRIIDLTK